MAGLLPFEFPIAGDSFLHVSDDENEFPTPPTSPHAFSLHKITFPEPKDKKRNTFQYRQRQQQHQQSSSSLPQTVADWKRLLDSVKREYRNGKYRQCLTRCNEVLENIRQLTHLQAAHLIYLHFYAACALETQARSLHPSSCHCNKMLKQARDHFARAFALVKIEDEDISRRYRNASAASPFNYMHMHSPCSSTVSWQSTAGSRVLSPTPSLTFSDCDTRSTTSTTIRRKKRVRFSSPIVAESTTIEPFIRPDSPTLGFDEMVVDSPHDNTFVPALPEIKSALITSPSHTMHYQSSIDVGDFEDPFALERSIHRYSTILDGLRRQLLVHLSSIDGDISALERKAATASPRLHNDEMKAMDLQMRIQRLKANGWQRKRFDGSRYEALRERAMADLAA